MPKHRDPNTGQFTPATRTVTLSDTEELYDYIGQLYRALCNTMDTVANIHDNGENCPYCGFEYPFTCEDGVAECTCYNHEDCDGNEAQKILNKVNEACLGKITTIIKAVK